MLYETASSTEDRPALRTSIRMQNEDQARINEIRSMVSSVLMIEREIFPRIDQEQNFDQLMIGAESALAISFEGRLILPSEQAYAALDEQLAHIDHLALFREAGGKHLIHVIRGRPTPQTRPWWPNALLFIITLFSVLIVGTSIAIGEIRLVNPRAANAIENNLFLELWRGLPYAISILLILGAHELGHYFAARRHNLAVTLPYFIPAPFISPIGTFGAFIQLREPMRNRKVLLDVGAAGPLTGLLFAIPILLIGLATSTVTVIQPGAAVEGNSLLYALSKIIVFGRFLPDGEVDVLVNQLAWAGWTGLLVTALNLIPVGQLDGGHILFALLGDAARRLYYPLMVAMVALVFFVSDMWLFWLVLLFLFGRVYAAPLDMITPLDRRRQMIAVLGLVVFAVTFTPVPFSIADVAVSPVGRSTALLALGLAALLRRRR